MRQNIKAAASKFFESTKNKTITVISHFDTDGITSAAIMAKTLTKLKKRFSLKIIKQLEPYIFDKINGEVVVFLDLGSSNLEKISRLGKEVFIIDHHEIPARTEIPTNITIVNPEINKSGEISASGLTYLFCKELNQNSYQELAKLAIIGMVGDMLDKEISKLNNDILKDAEVIVKKGLMLYPATRPINKALEFSSSFYIPGVTGNSKGVFDLLTEAGITKEGNTFKSLLELNDEEMSRLLTCILLRKKDNSEIIGNIYLIRFFNKLEDARELSAMINACSRLGNSDIALALCLNNKKAREKAEEIYAEYKQQIIQALNFVEQNKIVGKGYVIINAKNIIKDTIIGTVMSILSTSQVYPAGTIIIGLAYDEDKIKVSARVCGRDGRNVREVLELATKEIPETECGGHHFAAGCLIKRNFESNFMDKLTKALEIEVVKI
ncbi:MAG: DHH family phosphoesterase [Candidatus Pacearchaeota archaeon]